MPSLKFIPGSFLKKNKEIKKDEHPIEDEIPIDEEFSIDEALSVEDELHIEKDSEHQEMTPDDFGTIDIQAVNSGLKLEKKQRFSYSSLIIRIVFCISAVCFIHSFGYLLNNLVIIPLVNDSSFNDIREKYNHDKLPGADSGKWSGLTDEYADIDVNDIDELEKLNPYVYNRLSPRDENGVLKKFWALTAQYPDLKAWIEVPNTIIDYPVVQSTQSNDSNYYIHKGLDQKYNPNGSIFMDSRVDMTSRYTAKRNIVIYGHNMKSGAMFNNLTKYDSVDFYKISPVIRMDTIYERSNWVVISVMKCNTLEQHGTPFYYTITEFADDSEFEGFISDVKARSIIDTPYTADKDDSLLTLQTCSYEYKGFRTVIVARKIHEDENNIDVSSAKMAENPIMPDVWKN